MNHKGWDFIDRILVTLIEASRDWSKNASDPIREEMGIAAVEALTIHLDPEARLAYISKAHTLALLALSYHNQDITGPERERMFMLWSDGLLRAAKKQGLKLSWSDKMIVKDLAWVVVAARMVEPPLDYDLNEWLYKPDEEDSE